MAKQKNIVWGIEADTPSEYLRKKIKNDKEIFKDIRKDITAPKFFSEKHPYKELTYKEKQSEENESIALQRLKTDVHRDYKGNFTWLLFVARRELSFRKSQPNLISRYGSLFSKKKLTKLISICWEMEVYGYCVFYDSKRYDTNTLKDLILDFNIAKKHIKKARNIIFEKTYSESAKQKRHTPALLSMFGRSQNAGLTFEDSLKHELEILQFELHELSRIAEQDLKLPKSDEKKQKKLQYFIFLCEEIFKSIEWNYFPNLDLTNKTTYNKECKKFIIDMASILDEIRLTDPNTIINAYNRRSKYEMKYLGLMNCKTEEQFNNLLKKIYL